MCPASGRLLEGAQGTLCALGRPIALGTVRNGLFHPFPAFPAFPGFSSESGGPSLPLGPKVAEVPEVARMATFALLTTFGTLGTPGSRPAKLVWKPYSWPPELTESSVSWILGGHTARFTGTVGSGFSDISGKKCQKRVRRHTVSGLNTAQTCSI